MNSTNSKKVELAELGSQLGLGTEENGPPEG